MTVGTLEWTYPSPVGDWGGTEWKRTLPLLTVGGQERTRVSGNVPYPYCACVTVWDTQVNVPHPYYWAWTQQPTGCGDARVNVPCPYYCLGGLWGHWWVGRPKEGGTLGLGSHSGVGVGIPYPYWAWSDYCE